MSKIGRKAIKLDGVQAEIKGNTVYLSKNAVSHTYQLPKELTIKLNNDALALSTVKDRGGRKKNMVWGLHRALLANLIAGMSKPFEKQIKITGLGYKAVPQGGKIEFTLGFSHKVMFTLPKDVSASVDKTGQLLTISSANKEHVGKASGEIRLLRPTEPYKGTGVCLTTDRVIRKAGKTKAAG